jgi:hypothetical protein
MSTRAPTTKRPSAAFGGVDLAACASPHRRTRNARVPQRQRSCRRHGRCSVAFSALSESESECGQARILPEPGGVDKVAVAEPWLGESRARSDRRAVRIRIVVTSCRDLWTRSCEDTKLNCCTQCSLDATLVERIRLLDAPLMLRLMEAAVPGPKALTGPDLRFRRQHTWYLTRGSRLPGSAARVLPLEAGLLPIRNLLRLPSSVAEDSSSPTGRPVCCVRPPAATPLPP